jgi:hypothetical protein
MLNDWSQLEEIMSEYLDSFKVNFRLGENIGEQLDSLDRLSLISLCETKLKIDLTQILVNKEAWISFNSLIVHIIDKRNNNDL